MGKKYLAFKTRYIKRAMVAHYGQPDWNTEEKAFAKLGGADGVYDVYCGWMNLNEEQQREIVGFSLSDIEFDLAQAGL
ncbi:MAG: hypothetical protein II661_09675 [Bacteroidales bacterium]|nr:hypothetical protein [Bacteroidales bacterium]